MLPRRRVLQMLSDSMLAGVCCSAGILHIPGCTSNVIHADEEPRCNQCAATYTL